VDTLDGIVGRAARPIVAERIDTSADPHAVLGVLGERSPTTRFPVRLAIKPSAVCLHGSDARLQINPRPRGGSTLVLTLPVPADRARDDVAAVAQRELRRLAALAGGD
jgi:hypothetical protein